jgi:hypothetical protein
MSVGTQNIVLFIEQEQRISLFHHLSSSFESSTMPEDDFDIYGEDEGFNAAENDQVGQ